MKASRNAFNGGIIGANAEFRTDQDKYQSGLKYALNMLPRITGPAIRAPGLEYCGNGKSTDTFIRLIPFVFSENQALVLEFGNLYVRFWEDGELVRDVNEDIVEVVTPYTAEQLRSLYFVQSADVVYLCHSGHFPRRLERYSLDNDDWALVEMYVGSKQTPPDDLAGTSSGSGRDYSYVVTSVGDEYNEESTPSDPITVDSYETLSSTNALTLTWTEVEGSTLYNIYKDREESGVFGYVGSAAPDSNGDCTFVDRGRTPSEEERPPENRNPFDGEGNFPTTVTFFQQRLVFAGASNKVQTFYTSQTANFNNFNVSSPVKSDDAVTVTLASGQVNDIVWVHGGRKLQVGTIGGTWAVTGVDEGPLEPDSVDAREIGSLGCSRLRPIYLNGRTLYVQFDGRTVRELNYDFVSDSYIPLDQTVFVEDLFYGKRIVDWAYQSTPYRSVWVVLDDGSYASYSYDIEHSLSCWMMHETTNGFIESVCVVPSDRGEDVYFVIKREIDGSTVRYIERAKPYNVQGDVEDCFFVDSGLFISDESGMEEVDVAHLIGQEVAILADGYVVPEQTVSASGKITLPRSAQKVSVGIPKESYVDLLPDEIKKSDSYETKTTLLVPRTINNMFVAFERSAGGYWSIEDSDEYEIISKTASNLTGALELWSGVRELQLPGNNVQRPTVRLGQKDPLPFNIMAITTDADLAEK